MTLEVFPERINEYLKSAFSLRFDACSGLLEAMKYSLCAGGKRIRPSLVLEFCRITGGDPEIALPAAAAVEMIHTYSLIHDDLPAMDNDDLRRGKPTNHIVFGEANAILAGDALQAEAFRQIAFSSLNDNIKISCIRILSEAVGFNGMCGGQYMDIDNYVDNSFEQINTINLLKTCALLSASCQIGVVCGGGNDEQLQAASDFGEFFGKAFQIRDDVLDVNGDASLLGKNTGSDKNGEKVNFMSLFGEDRCNQMINEYSRKAKDAIKDSFNEVSCLFRFVDEMTNRNK